MHPRIKLIYPYNLIEALQFPRDQIWFIPYGTASDTQKQRLEEMIKTLTSVEQIAIYKHFQEEVSDSDMAAALGKSVESSKKVLNKAIRKLKTPTKATYIVIGDGEGEQGGFEECWTATAGADPDLSTSLDVLERLLNYRDINRWQYQELVRRLFDRTGR